MKKLIIQQGTESRQKGKLNLEFFFVYYAGTAAVLDSSTHLKPIKYLVLDAKPKWRDIGEKLGLNEKDLQAIHELDDGVCLDLGLQKVIKMKPTKFSFTDYLSNVLESSDIGHADMAIALREKVLPGSESL